MNSPSRGVFFVLGALLQLPFIFEGKSEGGNSAHQNGRSHVVELRLRGKQLNSKHVIGLCARVFPNFDCEHKEFFLK